ncbi:MAG: prepilin-type N-terminal cleavage/methylation domain-containing protein [Candidatus Omnitrophica bacterium]|nr:prepilin-type N-terminal cleavage/methylation domain-containing protein [Candidatus Omnitrophota bacterium]MBU4479101.1 prepilin-type N-terminal cleavage/methylation domain-containing protein [Candidatus Omnitrophota bacterium]
MVLTPRGFTLLEVMISITVFSIVFTSAAGMFSSVQYAWQKQKNSADSLRETQWAMELMINEIRRAEAGSVIVSVGGDRIRFQIDPNGDGNPPFRQIEYRRQGTVLNRRWRNAGGGGWTNPYQETANYLAALPPFSSGSGLVTITLDVTKGSVNYVLTSRVRPRN